MEPIVLWQTKWSHGPFVPMYLFLGGMAAGTFVVAAIADLIGIKHPRCERLAKVSAYITLPIALLAGLFLTFHLGKPERGLAFPIFFTNYESWMTRGGWIIGVAVPFTILYGGVWYFGLQKKLRYVLDVLGIPVVVLLAMYTGWLLSGPGFVPLWSKKFLPILFLNSGMLTGLAGAGFVFLLAWPFFGVKDEDPQRIVRWVSLAVVVFILLELLELYNFMTFLKGSGEQVPTGRFIAPKGGALAYDYVTKGELAPWFWWGIIGVGLTIPLVLTVLEFLVRPWARAVATTKFAMVVIGGVILRYVIVWGGNLKAPLDFPPSSWPIPPLAGG